MYVHCVHALVLFTQYYLYFGKFKCIYKLCNVADNFLCICSLGLLAPVTGCLSVYVKETLVTGSRGRFKRRNG